MNPARLLFRCLAALAAGAALAAETTPVRIFQTVEPRFPAALAFSTLTSGEANVIISVDDDGHLSDLLVSSYSDKAFADEAETLLKAWRYAPASQRGVPVGARVALKIAFAAPGRVVSMTPLDTIETLTRNLLQRPLVTRVCAPHELDQPVAIVQTVAPLLPEKAAHAGSTLLDFYVDEQGQARMPVVVKSTQETYTQAAVGALSQWRFAVPTRNGRPVAVRVRQEFVFPGPS